MKVVGPKDGLFSGRKRKLEVIAVLGPDSGIEPLPDEEPEEVPNGGVAGSDAAGVDGSVGVHSGSPAAAELRVETRSPPATPAQTELEPPPEPPPAAKKEKPAAKAATREEPAQPEEVIRPKPRRRA